MNILEWAAKWNVPAAALADLAGMATLGGGATETDGSESAVQQLVRLRAASLGNMHLFRNNVGVARTEDGERPVRYGLANDSKALNKKLKSADLIGWRSLLVQPHHVGTRLAQFSSIECKSADWKFSLTRERDQAQLAWFMLVSEAGGHAVFATGPDAL